MTMVGLVIIALVVLVCAVAGIYAYSRTRLTMQFKVYVSERRNGN